MLFWAVVFLPLYIDTRILAEKNRKCRIFGEFPRETETH
jgi:hypothetical protein